MSPRSAEFMAQARARLDAARRELAAGDGSSAVSLAYCALLYAARAALSEEDLYAKTHRGTWDLFWRAFAEPGRFDRGLAGEGRKIQELRELSDYEAQSVSLGQAEAVVDTAERFVAAIGDLYPD